MKEIWDTKFSKDKDKLQASSLVTTNMLNLGDEIGAAPDVDKIKKLIGQKRTHLENAQDQMSKKQIRA